MNVVRDNPVPIALTTIGIGWWMWNQRAGGRRVTYWFWVLRPSNFDSTWDTRSGYGAAGAEAGAYRRFDSDRGVWVGGDEGEATTDRVKHAVSDASERARDTLSNASEKARETVDDVTVRTRDAANRAQRQIGQYQPAGQNAAAGTGWSTTRWLSAPWRWRLAQRWGWRFRRPGASRS